MYILVPGCALQLPLPGAQSNVGGGRQGHGEQRGAWADSCHLLKGHSVRVWQAALPVPTRLCPAGTGAPELRGSAWLPGSHTLAVSEAPSCHPGPSLTERSSWSPASFLSSYLGWILITH